MLRRNLEQRRPPSLRHGSFLCIPRLRSLIHHSWFRIFVQDTDGDETRRNQDRQTGKTDDQDRNFLSFVHCAGCRDNRMFVLRTFIFRRVDVDVD